MWRRIKSAWNVLGRLNPYWAAVIAFWVFFLLTCFFPGRSTAYIVLMCFAWFALGVQWTLPRGSGRQGFLLPEQHNRSISNDKENVHE